VNAIELGEVLAKMYHEAPQGEAVVMIHLFGVKYASAIKEAGLSTKDVVAAARINPSYATEVMKGMNLARYVRPL
jgi:hypothetical protein